MGVLFSAKVVDPPTYASNDSRVFQGTTLLLAGMQDTSYFFRHERSWLRIDSLDRLDLSPSVNDIS